ncbi:ATP-binding cassette domain-containing protein, partial [Streptococcus merionis]|uniref:ATP-binding cassette domain-containing protein n=1 Tax=Streptococcus merionis TaxID=400065 RepID=UPI0026F20541
ENVSIGIDEFIGLPRTYQISSNGKNLSQGQQQKTLLKRALYEDKAVYLFDEPTSNLDLISKKRFVNLVLDLQSRGKIVCIITHDPELMGISTQILNLSEKA